jgi:hypothetical protein
MRAMGRPSVDNLVGNREDEKFVGGGSPIVAFGVKIIASAAHETGRRYTSQ